MPTWFLVGQKHCFLGPLISSISSGFSPLAKFSRLAAAADARNFQDLVQIQTVFWQAEIDCLQRTNKDAW